MCIRDRYTDFALLPAHQARIDALPATVQRQSSRDAVIDMLKSSQPQLVYFYCHGLLQDTNPTLMIGSKAEPGYLTIDNWSNLAIAWPQARPLMFINGCHTTAISPSQALNLVKVLVEETEAAGVIGTEITIVEELAQAFAEALIPLFLMIFGVSDVNKVAIAAFGITGVGGDEVMAYNYWLLEKGYAARTGPREDTPEWTARARGWIRIMYWDAFLSMLVYTFMTVAFYLLGAAILHAQGLKPEGYDMVRTLSRMYTDSLGSWAEVAFLIGSFFVLFSTLFSALAAWSRLFSDAFSSVGWMDYHNPFSRGRMIAILSFFFPALWAVLFFVFKDPVWMVLVGGAITAAILLLVVVGAVVMMLFV